MVQRLVQSLASLGIGTYYAAYYVGCLLAAAALAYATLQRRIPLRPWIVSGCRAVIVLLLARLVLFGNPVSFHYYVRSVGAADVGYRQYDAVMLEIANFRRNLNAERSSYLAVGSSQVAGIFYVWNPDLPYLMNVFSLAGMRSIDYLLYKNYIEAYHPKAIVLYLSGGDFALVPDFSSMHLAPPAPTVVPGVLSRLYQHGLMSGEHLGPLHEYLASQVVPEYRWSFLFRQWVQRQSQQLTRTAAGPPAGEARHVAAASPAPAGVLANVPPSETTPAQEAVAPDRAAADLADRVARFEASYDERWMPLYLSFLEDFVRFCEARGIPVIINQGQFNPMAITPKLERIQNLGVSALRDLSERHPLVRFVPATDVYVFGEAEYSDFVHVSADAAARYTRRFGEYLHRFESTAAAAPCHYTFGSGWHATEWQDGQNWLRWSDGTGTIDLYTQQAGSWAVEVDLLSAVQPNTLTLTVNDEVILERDAAAPSTKHDGQATFTAPPGRSVIRFLSQEAPAPGADQRLRSVAVRNFRLRAAADDRRQASVCRPAGVSSQD